jgi:hypothetical protein
MGLPMDRRPDPQLPQDFWSALWVGALFRGGAPPQRLTMGPVQKSQTTSLGGKTIPDIQV